MPAPAPLAAALADRYRIERELGAGGMATVYLAHDVRHDRRVAIKILHPELAAVLGADRFLTEMKVTASLQHPHILPLFDSGTAGGQLFYVMPVVEGDSLRDRLARERQLPIEDAVRITTEVASALDYAHRHGVVHRDIKPENILLHDGSAVVADFGIALAVSNAGDKRLTQTGLSLGTPQYMSPEQATGDRNVDGRTDIYSLGCVFYEMLTGEPPFSGPSAQAIVAKVLTEPVSGIRARRATVSPALEAVALKAVQKLPADRFATPQVFAQALRAPEQVSIVAPVAAGAATPSARSRWPVVAAAVGGLAALYGAYALGRQGATAAPNAGDWTIEQLGGPHVAMNPRVSPDGKTIAFAAMVGNQTQLAVLSTETGDWRVLTSDTTQGFVGAPAWSPDGTRIYYSRFNEAPNGIYSITPLGTDDRLVLERADVPLPLADGSMLAVRLNSHRRLQLYRYWAQSARLDSLPASTTLEWGKAFARTFPDGKEAAFVGVPGPRDEGTEAVYAIDLATGKSRRLWTGPVNLSGGESFGVSADNQSVLLQVRMGGGYAVMSVPRDGSGEATTVLSTTSRISALDGGPDGSIYIDQLARSCVWFRYEPTTRLLERHDLLPRCANEILPLPDGRILETERGDQSRVVAIKPGSPPTRFLQVDQPTSEPAPLGADRVLVRFGRNGDTLLVALAATGRVTARIPWFPDAGRYAGSPDGATIYFARAGAIWAMPAGGGEPRRIRDGDGFALDPTGRYLAVAVNAPDRVHLFHVPLDGTAESEIAIKGPVVLSPESMNLTAIGRDGRILVTGVSAALWHWPAAILDPGTGSMTVLPVGTEYDAEGSWTPDGKVWIVGEDLQASMWRYRPVRRSGR
jgi:tRNA A-37 threonylcarbamoyl transferase component Bud32